MSGVSKAKKKQNMQEHKILQKGKNTKTKPKASTISLNPTINTNKQEKNEKNSTFALEPKIKTNKQKQRKKRERKTLTNSLKGEIETSKEQDEISLKPKSKNNKEKTNVLKPSLNQKTQLEKDNTNNNHVVKSRPQTRHQAHMKKFFEQGGWSNLLFSAVLFGNRQDPKKSEQYMSKSLQNLEILNKRYPGSQVVLYYDETISEDLIKNIKRLTLPVILIFVRHSIGRGIMLTRLLELSKQRPGVKWVVIIDIHDELHKMESFLLGIEKAVINVMIPTVPIYTLQITWWSPQKKAKCVEFKGRFPHLHIDAGGVAASPFAEMEPIETFIDQFLHKYQYVYGDDEFVLDNWVQARVPKWFFLPRNQEIFFLEMDGESIMDLSGARIIDPQPIGVIQGLEDANEVLDWTKYHLEGLDLHVHCCVPCHENYGQIQKQKPATKSNLKKKKKSKGAIVEKA
jgi:hypothetical protein